MSLRTLLSQTVTVQRSTEGEVDGYGTPSRTWGEVGTYAARLEQTSGTEQNADRRNAVGDWLLILPAHADLNADDRVVSGPFTFDVVGPPNAQRTPRGVSHIEARLRFVVGA